MKPSLFFLCLLFITFVIRLIILINSSHTFYSDDATYAILARMWTEGDLQHVFHPTWPPLFPALSALVYLLTNNFEIALRLVSLVSGVLLIIPLFQLMKNTLSVIDGLVFVLALTFLSPLVLISLLPLSDSLAMLLTVSGVIAFFIAFKGDTKRRHHELMLLGSLLFGLNFLTRPEGSMFFFLTIVFLCFFFLIRSEFKKILIVVPMFICVFFLTISPYAIAIRLQIQEWSLSPKFSAQIQQGHVFALNKRNTTWAQEVGSAKNPDYNSPYFKNGLGYTLDRFNYLKNLLGQKQAKWVNVFLSVFPAWSVVMILVGMMYVFSKRYFWPLLYLIFIMATSIPITIFTAAQFDVRYLAWSIPFLLFLFYLGIKKIFSCFSQMSAAIPALVCFGLIMTFPGFSASPVFAPGRFADDFTQRYDKKELKEVGLWIKNNFPRSNPRIMMRHEGVEFYSEGETIYLPQVDYQDLIDYARKNRVDFIVAWDENLTYDEKLSSLMDRRIDHPGLKEVYAVEDNSMLKAIIYQLN